MREFIFSSSIFSDFAGFSLLSDGSGIPKALTTSFVSKSAQSSAIHLSFSLLEGVVLSSVYSSHSSISSYVSDSSSFSGFGCGDGTGAISWM